MSGQPKSIEDTPEFKRLQKLKKQKKQNYKKPENKQTRMYTRKKSSNRSSCCFLYLIIFLVIVVLITAAVAKLGIFTIPGFSDIFYTTPEPTHKVEPDSLLGEDLISDLVKQDLGEVITIQLTESQLTAIMQSSIEKSQNFNIEELQAVTMPNGVEIFGHMLEPINAYLTLVVLPKVEQELLAFEVIEIKVGNLPLPSGLANLIIENLLTEPIKEINETILLSASLQSIQLSDGIIKIKVEL